MPTLVMIPKIKDQVEEWGEILERGERELPGMFFQKRSVSTAMKVFFFFFFF
jgi:hypothetical protein